MWPDWPCEAIVFYGIEEEKENPKMPVQRFQGFTYIESRLKAMHPFPRKGAPT